MVDLKKEGNDKIVRISPSAIKDLETVLSIYTHVPRIKGVTNNAHYKGLRNLQKLLRKLSGDKEYLSKGYIHHDTIVVGL